jgi:hypothetical protein
MIQSIKDRLLGQASEVKNQFKHAIVVQKEKCMINHHESCHTKGL